MQRLIAESSNKVKIFNVSKADALLPVLFVQLLLCLLKQHTRQINLSEITFHLCKLGSDLEVGPSGKIVIDLVTCAVHL